MNCKESFLIKKHQLFANIFAAVIIILQDMGCVVCWLLFYKQ